MILNFKIPDYKLQEKGTNKALATFKVTFSQTISCKTRFNKINKKAHNGFINCTKQPIGLVYFNNREIDMNAKHFFCSEFKVEIETTRKWFIMHITFTPPEDKLFFFYYFFQNKYWHESNYQGVFSMMQTSKITIIWFLK